MNCKECKHKDTDRPIGKNESWFCQHPVIRGKWLCFKSVPLKESPDWCPLKCTYCNTEMSNGNDSLHKDGKTDIYIVESCLYVLNSGENIAAHIKINFCPMCGKFINERK